MDRKRSVLAIVLMTALLFSMVGIVSASSQTWYWTNDNSGLPSGADYQMKKTHGQGTAHITDVGAGTAFIWVADEAVTEGPLDMAGAWPVQMQYYVLGPGTVPIKLKVEIGTLSGGTFTPEDEATLDTTKGTGIAWWKDFHLSPDPFSISNGEYLAARFTNHEDSSTIEIALYYEAHPTYDGPTWIESPSTDPGYPVPELSTILLTSIGVLMLGGFVVYSRRRNNK